MLRSRPSAPTVREDGVRLRHCALAAGVDEAGRGPLAGPVVAAAVILPKHFDVRGINDSKQLRSCEREHHAERIKRRARWSIAAVDVSEVDGLNIFHATMKAMRLALEGLGAAPDRVFIDGNHAPHALPYPRVKTIVGGDTKLACVAAASILAKTYRDELMRGLSQKYPQYGFERHFGYSTPEHLAAIAEYGPCEVHRRSFWRIKAALGLLDEPSLFAEIEPEVEHCQIDAP